MSNDDSNKMMIATAIIDNPLFSSPQNRRASMVRYSQKSQISSLPLLGQPKRSARDTAGTINRDINMGGPSDSSTRGGAADIATVDVSSDSLREAYPPSCGSRNALPVLDRIQEVLGAMPILLVDDSVSILKMTKRAIQNECANIRSTHSIYTSDFLHLLIIYLSTRCCTLSSRYQLYGGQERWRSIWTGD